MGMFDWTEKSAEVLLQGGVIAPDERLPWPQTAAMGVQHVIAMFGATVLAPILMGFDPNIAILMSGVGTLIFFLITGRQGSQLPGLELRLHRRGDRGHRLRRQGTQRQHRRSPWAASSPAASSTPSSAQSCRRWARTGSNA